VLESCKDRRPNSCQEQCQIPPPSLKSPLPPPLIVVSYHRTMNGMTLGRIREGKRKGIVHLSTLPQLLQILTTNFKIASKRERSHPLGFLSAVPCTPCLLCATLWRTNRLQHHSLQYKASLRRQGRWRNDRHIDLYVNPEVFFFYQILQKYAGTVLLPDAVFK
jgi:hypothetical protein